MEDPHAPTPGPLDRGVIQRVAWGAAGELPHIEYLHRDDVLFAEDEWKFSCEEKEGYVFSSYLAAADFAEELTRKGTKCFALVVAVEARRQERERKESDRVLTALASMPDERLERHQEMMRRNRLD